MHDDSDIETLAEDDHALPDESLIATRGRSKLESDILAVASKDEVQTALRKMLSASATTENQSTLQIALRMAAGLKDELRRGVQLLLSASCDKRLEVSHWMVSKIRAEEDASDVVEWFFMEAGYLRTEADDVDAELIRRIFGSGTECV